jgi:hypothetical protein
MNTRSPRKNNTVGHSSGGGGDADGSIESRGDEGGGGNVERINWKNTSVRHSNDSGDGDDGGDNGVSNAGGGQVESPTWRKKRVGPIGGDTGRSRRSSGSGGNNGFDDGGDVFVGGDGGGDDNSGGGGGGDGEEGGGGKDGGRPSYVRRPMDSKKKQAKNKKPTEGYVTMVSKLSVLAATVAMMQSIF